MKIKTETKKLTELEGLQVLSLHRQILDKPTIGHCSAIILETIVKHKHLYIHLHQHSAATHCPSTGLHH